MDLAPLLSALPDLLAVAFIGRVALSLFPPGWPGGHSARELPATWAASHLLGLALLALQTAALGLVVLLTSWQPRSPGLWLLAPWAVLGLLRLATLPGAMRPRHESRREPGSRAVRAAGGIGALLLAAFALTEGAEPAGRDALVRTGGVLAAAVLAVGALGQARRAPRVRATALVALGVAAWLAGPPLAFDGLLGPTLLPPLLTAAAASATVWLRRADRRAAASAVLCLAALPLAGPAGIVAASIGLAGLLGSTPAPARRRLMRLGLPAVLVGLLLAGLSGPLALPASPPSAGAVAVLLACAVALPALALRRARVGPTPGRAEPRARAAELRARAAEPRARAAEPCARAAVAAGAFLAAGALGWLLADLPGVWSWLALAPLVALATGLAAPAERLERSA